jgi:hypothetical protein
MNQEPDSVLDRNQQLVLTWQASVEVGETRAKDSVFNHSYLVVFLWLLSYILCILATFFALNQKSFRAFVMLCYKVIPKSSCSGVPDTTYRVLG